MTVFRKFLGVAMCTAIAMTAATQGAWARDLPAQGLSRQDILEWLQKHGYKATRHDDSLKENIITTSFGGVSWDIYVYACTGEYCKSIQFAAGWSGAPVTVAQVNDWNSTKRYLRAYKNDAGLWAEYDIDIAGGTWEQLDHSLDRWNGMVATFKQFETNGVVPK